MNTQNTMEIFYPENQIDAIAQQLIEEVKSKTLCFYGEMGAGKTTLIKAIVQRLGGHGIANSPTFGIVNEYYSDDGELLAYHFDFYRLNNEIEALDMGLEDYLSEDVWIFMEWPEKISTFLPEEKTDVYITSIDRTTRQIRIKNNL